MAYITDANGESHWLAYDERAQYLSELTEEEAPTYCFASQWFSS